MIDNAAEQASGRAGEAAGRAIKNERLGAAGPEEQTACEPEKVGEYVEDVFK